MRGSNAGFTLLELLVVLCILALSYIFAAPMFKGATGNTALLATAQKIANEMRVARASAIRDNVERTLTIDLASRRFWVDGVTGVSKIADGISVDFVTLQKEQLSAREGRIRFFVDGSATGGNVILRANQRTVTIALDWMTGHADLRRER
jgi:general secretion pathway protein H